MECGTEIYLGNREDGGPGKELEGREVGKESYQGKLATDELHGKEGKRDGGRAAAKGLSCRLYWHSAASSARQSVSR